MVKLPTSSNAPALPRPRTAPLGPGPETFCHASGAMVAGCDEQSCCASNAAAATARPAQRASPCILDPLPRVMGGGPSAPLCFAPPQTPPTMVVNPSGFGCLGGA